MPVRDRICGDHVALMGRVCSHPDKEQTYHITSSRTINGVEAEGAFHTKCMLTNSANNRTPHVEASQTIALNRHGRELGRPLRAMGAQCGDVGRGPPDPSQPRPPRNCAHPFLPNAQIESRRLARLAKTTAMRHEQHWWKGHVAVSTMLPAASSGAFVFVRMLRRAPHRCHDRPPSGRHRLHAHPGR